MQTVYGMQSSLQTSGYNFGQNYKKYGLQHNVTYRILHYLCRIQEVTSSVMKEFFQLMGRFVAPYKKYVCWAVVLNLLSAIFNVFSFFAADSYPEHLV